MTVILYANRSNELVVLDSLPWSVIQKTTMAVTLPPPIEDLSAGKKFVFQAANNRFVVGLDS